MTIELNTSWLNGKYPQINAEINVNFEYVAIGDYFWQGDEANNVIDEIHNIWTDGNMSVEEAIEHYALQLP